MFETSDCNLSYEYGSQGGRLYESRSCIAGMFLLRPWLRVRKGYGGGAEVMVLSVTLHRLDILVFYVNCIIHS